ncbi:MAG: hypothetical protein ABW019_16200 [Chitinophagaceae bacterium]
MKTVLLALSAALLISSCATPKISVSDDLKDNHDEYTVKGRQGILVNQKLSFGEYRTQRVKRSWTKGSSTYSGFGFGYPGTEDYTNIISNEYIRRKQTVFFSLEDAKQKSEVYCTSRFNAKEFTLGKNENSLLNIVLDIFGKGGSSDNKFYVQIYTGENETPWQMMIDNQAAQAQAKSYTGILARGKDRFYTIVPVTRLEMKGRSGNILAGSVGFEFRDQANKTVAAVSMLDKGMVFLGKTDAEERFLLANACAALLLQQNIEA